MGNLYELLGVERDATEDEITRAYRKKAKELHPDVNGEAGEFVALAAAYETLSDSERRAHYDETGTEEDPGAITPQVVALQTFAQLVRSGNYAGCPFATTAEFIENDRERATEALEQARAEEARLTAIAVLFTAERPSLDPFRTAVLQLLRLAEAETEQAHEREHLLQDAYDWIQTADYEGLFPRYERADVSFRPLGASNA